MPDPGERSEAYLRAILLSLNCSIFPDGNPTAPPTWTGPPQEIITTSDLLYASLLMSLLAAFVAMLSKQWLNRYLRHAGGSMIERLRRPPAQIQQSREVAVPIVHRASSHRAPVQIALFSSPAACYDTCYQSTPLSHASSPSLLSSASPFTLRVSIPNASVDSSSKSQRQWDNHY